jgi:CHAT domain-containing protein
MAKGFGKKQKEDKLKRRDYLDFLHKILGTIREDKADIAIKIIENNLDKLDRNFISIFRDWATETLSQLEADKADERALNIADFSSLVGELQSGNMATNLDIAIVGLEVVETVYKYEIFPNEWAITKINLGNCYNNRIFGDSQDNLEKAITFYHMALDVYKRDYFPVQWADIHNNLATVYMKRIKGNPSENLEKAITACNVALEVLTKEKFPKKWAITQTNLANAYCDKRNSQRSENIELAINIYNASLEVLTHNYLPELWAKNQGNLGTLYSEIMRKYASVKSDLFMNAFDLAMEAYQNSLKVYTRVNYPFAYAWTQIHIGLTYHDLDLVEQARTCYQLALEIFAPKVYPAESIRAARNLGKLAFQSGRLKEAIQAYEIAIEAVETRHNWAKSESRRQEILAESIYIYQNIVQACINNQQIDKAFEYSERSRSKLLVDLMASSHLSQHENIPPNVQELLQKYEELQQQIDIERQNYKSENNPSETRAIWQVYNEKIASLETTKQDIWEQLRKEDPILAGEIQVKPLSLSEVQQLIDHPKTAILSFYTTNSDTHIFIITQNSIYLHSCIGEGLERLQKWIEQNWLSNYIHHPEKWENDMEHFHHELAERLQLSKIINQYLQDIEELIIEPHLLLHQIPFAALPTGEYQEYLVDRFLIRYTPSCQILDFCHQNHKKKRLNLDIQYGTVEDATDDLHCARWEGEQIAKIYNIPSEKRLIGSSQATVQNYRKLAEQVQTFHSCHHAESCLYNPLESQLKLGDGSITLGQLMSPGWRLPHLVNVFLSCCETNLDNPDITDNLLTLSTGFLCAGAISVISSLWKVDDLATALFSIFYYQQRQEGKNCPAALKEAQIKLRELRKADLEEISQAAEHQRKQARNQKEQYPQDSEEYLECDFQHKKSLKILNTINHIQKSTAEFPFAHPRYWSAFIAQGLQ